MSESSRGDLILLFLGFIVGVIIAFTGQQYRIESMKADIAGDHARQLDGVIQVLDAAIKRLNDATEHGDFLTKQLQERETALTTLKKEKNDAITIHSTGRTCFSAGLVRVLNATPGSPATTLPTPASVLVAEDGPVATDTNVAGWVANAQQQYDVCRARFTALIDWHIPVKGDKHD